MLTLTDASVSVRCHLTDAHADKLRVTGTGRELARLADSGRLAGGHCWPAGGRRNLASSRDKAACAGSPVVPASASMRA